MVDLWIEDGSAMRCRVGFSRVDKLLRGPSSKAGGLRVSLIEDRSEVWTHSEDRLAVCPTNAGRRETSTIGQRFIDS